MARWKQLQPVERRCSERDIHLKLKSAALRVASRAEINALPRPFTTIKSYRALQHDAESRNLFIVFSGLIVQFSVAVRGYLKFHFRDWYSELRSLRREEMRHDGEGGLKQLACLLAWEF